MGILELALKILQKRKRNMGMATLSAFALRCLVVILHMFIRFSNVAVDLSLYPKSFLSIVQSVHSTTLNVASYTILIEDEHM